MVEEQKEVQDQLAPERPVFQPEGRFAPPRKPERPPLPKKPFIIAGVIVGVLVILGLAAYLVMAMRGSDPGAAEQQAAQQPPEPEAPKTTLRMLATGDWIAHDTINANAKQGDSYDYSPMLEPFGTHFKDSDINFCNVATPAGGEQFGISGYPVFNAPLAWLDDMQQLGCNVYNTGTNHTNDKGQRVITSELNHLDGLQGLLAHAGANRSNQEQQEVRYFEVEGVKFAFVSYSTYTNIVSPNGFSLNMFKPELYEPQMEEARAQADVVIVSMRWGTEYSNQVNAAQDSVSQTLANLGADIVLGHGTHYLQPVKRLQGMEGRETVVWYGLGNFLNSQVEVEALTGCVAQIDIDIATKKVQGTSCLPFYQHYDWTAEEYKNQDLLKRKNVQIMPLYNAADFMAKSPLGISVEEQMERINGLVNTYTEVPVQNASDL